MNNAPVAPAARMDTGRARYLGSANGMVHRKTDKGVVQWSGPAELYLLTPALRGYNAVVVASNEFSDRAADYEHRIDIFGLEGEGLLLDWDDVAGGPGFRSAADALADAGYVIV